jgi:hydroxymethylpyrimidine pyrophosphatase-like HAD family hydrolase
MDMIEYAGLGVAMGNAPDYLKKVADFVTHSNDEDGVRQILEKFILK